MTHPLRYALIQNRLAMAARSSARSSARSLSFTMPHFLSTRRSLRWRVRHAEGVGREGTGSRSALGAAEKRRSCPPSCDAGIVWPLTPGSPAPPLPGGATGSSRSTVLRPPGTAVEYAARMPRSRSLLASNVSFLYFHQIPIAAHASSYTLAMARASRGRFRLSAGLTRASAKMSAAADRILCQP